MHPELHGAVATLGIEEQLAPIAEAANFSQQVVDNARSSLQTKINDQLPIDIIVQGSIARQEANGESDLDYIVITHGLFDDPASSVREVLEALQEVTNELQLHDPGSSGLFGKIVAAQDLVERIGLQDDTNAHHTRRILLITESVSVFNENLHQRLLVAVVQRYLGDYGTPKTGVPRFLLNDVLRYWRTLTVDYQAKQWGKTTPEWGLRYLKLIITRKLMIAGTVCSLFMCDEATPEYFVEQFGMPALARLAQVHERLEPNLHPEVANILIVAAEFNQALSDSDFRDEAKKVRSRNDIPADSQFSYFQERARSMQNSLERVFFDSRVLGDKSRKYLSF